MDRKRRVLGMAIAAAAAGLFVASTPAVSAADGSVKVKCYGANACKGKAECKTAMNSCKGHNACKGQGFMMMDEKACISHFGRT